jgi:hypothetical protein
MTTSAFFRRFRYRTVLALLFVALAAQLQPATASIGWCKTDPKISVGGHIAHIYISSPTDILNSALGPTKVVVTVPTGYAASAEVLYQDNGFGFGYEVSFVESSDLTVDRNGNIQILATIKVPALVIGTSVKVELALADGTTVISKSNGSVNSIIKIRGAI